MVLQTPLGIQYPEPPDSEQLWVHYQNLATTADAAITASKAIGHAADASGATTVSTTSDIDIVGATLTFTLATDRNLWIIGTWDCSVTAFTSLTAITCNCKVDGTNLTGAPVWVPTAASQRTTVSRSWLTFQTAGSHTVKLTSRLSAANLTISVAASNSGLTVTEQP